MTAAPAKTVRVTIFAFALSLTACGGGDKSVAPPVATSLTANSGTSLTGVAGAAVTDRPSVIMKDQRGDPMAGVPVTFAVTTGGGTITGNSVTTNASGVATVGGWTLGATAGPNSLTATAGSLAGVTFTATGTAGAAASLTKTAGDNQAALAGSAVSVPPAVTVRDANGNLVSGTVVTFTVASGGGSVTGGTATSNSSGLATVGSWTLGTLGTNTLTATAVGAPSVTFTATATWCSVSTVHTIGTTSNGTLSTSDCRFADGSYVDFYSTTVSTASAYLFTQSASSFDTYLLLLAADQTPIAENNDASATTSNSAIKALLPSDNYILAANSRGPGATGSYALSSSTTSVTVTNCETVYIVRGLTTTQNVSTTDCVEAGPYYSDRYFIYLKAGQSLTVTMSSTAVDSWLELYDSGGNLVAVNDDRDEATFDARIVYTPPVAGYYRIFARTNSSGETGSYSLTIQ